MESNDMADIAPRIRCAVEESSDSSADLAQLLDVDLAAAEALMAGERGMAAGELAQICARYDLTTDELLFGKKPVVLMRADADAEVDSFVGQVEAVFEDYQYLKALVGA